MPKDGLFNVAHNARLVGVDYGVLWRAVTRGEVPSTGEPPLVRVVDVKRWLATRERAARVAVKES